MSVRGFLFLDAMIGLALLATLMAVLSVAIARHEAAARSLRDARAADRQAEFTLSTLQTGGSPVPVEPDVHVRARPSDDPSGVPGYRWAEVTVEVRGQRRVLIGLIPALSGAPERGTP